MADGKGYVTSQVEVVKQTALTGVEKGGLGVGLIAGAGFLAYAALIAFLVALVMWLADLIGRAIRSGTPRALELKGKGTHTTVKWQSDGSLAATLELIQSPKIR